MSLDEASRALVGSFKRLITNREDLKAATKILQQPETRALARSYPETKSLFYAWTILGFTHLVFIVAIPILLFFVVRWYWAIALGIISILTDILILQTAHNSVNLELFARLWILDDSIKERWREVMER